MAALAAQNTDDVLVVAVDALDEAEGEQDLADLRQALRELARLGWLRVAVATRPLATGDVYGPGTHLYGLGVVGAQTAVTWSIWTSTGSSPLTISSLTPTLCWPRTGSPIRDHRVGPGRPTGRTRMCAHGWLEVVASRADRNYLVAGMSAFQLAEDDRILDPAISVVRPVGYAPRHRRSIDQAPRQALRAAAATRNGPADGARLWPRGRARRRAMAGLHPRARLSRRSRPGILAELKASAAADYLLETSTEPDELVTRLFHQALADELVAAPSPTPR